ncbi:MAG: outer membrane protein assembly factor BamA [Proteobacteria bacterium]|nr:outer membrane protein assembly factor BamA [Cystobacterineae bacterium]MCL2259292.1 outer membrane protein assembly factor BamA [Cystobacterineae bacterium]MCL2314289.1 outer membrane protein assembly factor BamA [Pseudomonadota bacterium]
MKPVATYAYLLLACCWASSVLAQDAQLMDVPLDAELPVGTIADIRFEGLRRVEPEAIRRAMRQQRGDVFDAGKTAEDLSAIWALGYFVDVQLSLEKWAGGQYAYVVQLKERPVVHEVRFEGHDELSESDFKELVTIKALSILDVAALQKNAKKIQEKYAEKGFFLAEVQHRLEPIGTEGLEVDVVFVIREHAKVMVKRIQFFGVEQVPEEDLRSAMATREGGFLSFLTGEGIFRDDGFQYSLQAIQAVYYDRGFINVRVESPQVSLSADKRYVFIGLRIEEGLPFDLGKLGFSGDELVPPAQLRPKLKSRSGQRFSRSSMMEDIQTISDAYYDLGYAYANVTPLTDLDTENRIVDIVFDIQKGERVKIERIDIIGNTKTRDKVIRREVRVYEGELFSGTAMKRSQERVTALGYFEKVEVTHRPGSTPGTIVVSVEVKEKPTGSFQLSLGFSSYENLIFMAQVQESNFLGWGQSLVAAFQISSLRQHIQLAYTYPYFLDTDFVFSAEAFRAEADYFGFSRNSWGGNVNLGYYLWEDVTLSVGYGFESVKVERGYTSSANVPFASQYQKGTLSTLRLSAQWDKRDNRLFPTKGFLQYVSAELGPSFLGGSFVLNRYTAFSRWYVPLFWGLVLKANATIGYIQQLNSDKPIPISERYFLGGIDSVRGYYLRSISPSVLVPSSSRPDAGTTSFAVGGDKKFVFNLELEFPIFPQAGIRGVVFYDAGNAFAMDAKFFQDKQNKKLPLSLYHSVGFGFRWFSPVGPLRFEWGIPLNRRPQDDSIAFEFNIGNSF